MEAGIRTTHRKRLLGGKAFPKPSLSILDGFWQKHMFHTAMPDLCATSLA